MSHAMLDRRPVASLDPGRVLALSVAISLNATLLLMALRPLPAPLPLRPVEERTVIRLLPPRPVPPAPPALPAPPPLHPRVVPHAPHVPMPARLPTPAPSPVSLPGPVAPVTATVADAPSTVTAAPTGPVNAALTYLRAPPPRYPMPARRARLEGTVTLRVRVDMQGRPIQVSIARSSGYPILDRAARRKVLRDWRFEPARIDGRLTPAWALVPVTFRLQTR